MKTKIIKLSDIVIDAGTQQRVSPTDSVIDDYAESIKCGSKFPPITVFSNGVEYYLVDGFHRYFANKRAGGIDEIEAEVHEGSKRDAILYSASVNGTHGLRLTNQDKRKHVLVLLNDDEWSEWSDTAIAKHCKVTQQFVSKVRREINDIQKDIISSDIKTVLDSASKPAQNLETENEEIEEYDEKEQEILELKDAVVSLDEENTRLKDALAANQLPEDEIQSASEIIADLRALVKSLEAELDAVKSSRDSYMVENGELKKQLVSQRNQLKKLGAEK